MYSSQLPYYVVCYINMQKKYIYITSWNVLRNPKNENTAYRCLYFSLFNSLDN
jgi:hypothetical protein